jgi:hypothetical protein
VRLRFAFWIVSRAVETAALAALLLILDGGASHLGLADIVLMVLFFYLASGYLGTVAWFGFVKPPTNFFLAVLIVPSLYIAHATFLLSWNGRPPNLPLVAYGACAVLAVTIVFHSLLLLVLHKRKQESVHA